MATTITGLDQVIADIDRAGLTIGLRASRVVNTYAAKVEATQRSTVRRRSGATARSIESTNEQGHRLGFGDLHAVVGTDHWRAHFIEFGTQQHPPFPFASTSLDPHRAGFIAAAARIAGQI